MSPYDALADLAERELELAAAGEAGELAELQAERSALVAALPAMPPAEARPALERAATIQGLVTDLLAERVRESGGELGRVARGRSAIQGYAPRVDPLKLVDREG